MDARHGHGSPELSHAPGKVSLPPNPGKVLQDHKAKTQGKKLRRLAEVHVPGRTSGAVGARRDFKAMIWIEKENLRRWGFTTLGRKPRVMRPCVVGHRVEEVLGAGEQARVFQLLKACSRRHQFL